MKFLCRNGHTELNPLTQRCWRCTYNEKRRVAYQMSKRHSIFVYGTLKRGCGNHHLMQQPGVEFVREAWLPFARIYGYQPIGGVPFVKLDKDACSSVKGEVYSVPAAALTRLDRLEGHPSAYRRTAVTLLHGEQAEVYEWQGTVDRLHELEGGEYKAYQPEEVTIMR